MDNIFASYKIATLLKNKGYNEPCFSFYSNKHFDNKIYFDVDEFELFHENQNDKYEMRISAPIYQEIISWLDQKGYYIKITPEFYKDSICWNWQIWWYLPEEKWIKNNYLDNNKYPTRILAIQTSIEHVLTELI